MAMKIRLARGGSKKRPHYSIVAADSRMPRDGRFIEKLGTYNPLLPKDSEDRVRMDAERIQHWLGQGAQPTDRISRMLEAAGIVEKKARNNPNKGKPGKAAEERAQSKLDKAAAAAEAAAAPKEEPVAEEAVAEEAVADDAATVESAAVEAAAETPAEETKEETKAEAKTAE